MKHSRSGRQTSTGRGDALASPAKKSCDAPLPMMIIVDSGSTWGICNNTRRAGKLYKARSRLYRSQILQINTRWKALAEIYTMHSFAPFWISIITSKFARKKCNFNLATFSQNLPEVSQISAKFDEISNFLRILRTFRSLEVPEVPRRYSGIGTSSGGRCIRPDEPPLLDSSSF